MTHTSGAVADAGTVGSRSVALLVSQLRWAALALAIVIPAILNPNFRSYDNLQGFLQSIGVLLILAMGQSFVLLIAGIDLSVGAVLAMGSVVLAGLLQHGWPLWAAVSGTLAAGSGIGLLSGASVVILNIPSFIVTFAFMGIAYAAGLVISGGDRIGLPASSALPKLATGEIFGVPYQIVLALALLGVGTLGLRHLTIGRRLYAVGGNSEAARLSGLSIPRTTLVAFGLSGLFASIAAVVYTARIVSGNPIGGGNLNLQSIAAAVIGGVSLFGGRGTLVGACFGALLYSLIENVLNLYNVNPNITEIVAGVIVLLAGLINVLTDSRRAKA
jgi:ribose transport system permease protein